MAMSMFALETGLIDHNPVRNAKKINSKSDGFRTWTVAEVAAFEARHPVGTMARLAWIYSSTLAFADPTLSVSDRNT